MTDSKRAPGQAGPEKSGEKEADQLTEQVQAKVDDEQEKGYRGVSADPTPRENYTVAGVAAEKPTPETHEDAAVETGSNKFSINK